MMAQCKGESLDIDTFLLSCRVIGRSIESSMLAQLGSEAAVRGLRDLRGHIISTPKNEPVRDVFAKHGFAQCGKEDSASSSWVMSLENGGVSRPEWIEIRSSN